MFWRQRYLEDIDEEITRRNKKESYSIRDGETAGKGIGHRNSLSWTPCSQRDFKGVYAVLIELRCTFGNYSRVFSELSWTKIAADC